MNMEISHQLLEKTRLCMNRNSLGTNFHVLYLLALYAPEHTKTKYKLRNQTFTVSLLFKSIEPNWWYNYSHFSKDFATAKTGFFCRKIHCIAPCFRWIKHTQHTRIGLCFTCCNFAHGKYTIRKQRFRLCTNIRTLTPVSWICNEFISNRPEAVQKFTVSTKIGNAKYRWFRYYVSSIHWISTTRLSDFQSTIALLPQCTIGQIFSSKSSRLHDENYVHWTIRFFN